MEGFLAPLVLLIGIAAGAVVAWIARGRELAVERERALRAETAQIGLAASLQEEKMARAAAEAAAAAEQRGHEQRIIALTELRGEIEQKMHSLAGAALQSNQATFLSLAGEFFATHKASAAESHDQRQQALAALLAPLATRLEE